MFERFTKGVRRAVVDAQSEARRLGDDHVGTKHLLLALTMSRDDSAEVLDATKITHEIVEGSMVNKDFGEEDAEVLGVLGIDLDEVKRTVEATFGEGALSRDPTSSKGHIRFTGEAKKTLELSLREAMQLGHKHIGTEHLLLGLLRNESNSARVWLIGRGCDPDGIRATLIERLRRAS